MNSSIGRAGKVGRLQLEMLEPRRMLSLSSKVMPALESDPIEVASFSETPSIRSPYRPPAKGEELIAAPTGGLQQALEDALLGESGENETPTAPPTIEDFNSRVNLPISGDGFFLVQSGNERLLTRDSDLQFDEQYELVTADGNRVLGYGVDQDGEVVSGQLVPLRLPIAQEFAVPTTQVSFAGVLNPHFSDELGTSTEIVVFDADGNETHLTLTAVLLSRDSESTTFTWTIRYQPNQEDDKINFADGLLRFDENGDFANDEQPRLFVETATASFWVELDFDSIKALGETDAQGNPISSINAVYQNGFAPGQLEDLIVIGNGFIQGQFDTGFQLTLGQIVLGKVANPHGLQRVGTATYDISATSGQLIIGEPGSDSFGSLVSLPAGYSLRHDGLIEHADEPAREYFPSVEPNGLNLQYPWLVREANLEISDNEYFVVETADGTHQYTQDGRFRLNSNYELVTLDGLRVLGYSLDDNSSADHSRLVPLTIPFEERIAKATENVEFAGNLVPEIAVATTLGVLESHLLLNGAIEAPDRSAITITPVGAFDLGEGLTIRSSNYSFTFYNPNTQLESRPASSNGLLAGIRFGEEFLLKNLPVPTSELFTHVRIYRSVYGDIGLPRLLAEVQTRGPGGVTSYLDQSPDDHIRTNPQLNLNGPLATEETLLVDLQTRDGVRYSRLLDLGELSISDNTNSINSYEQKLVIDETTTVNELVQFLAHSLTLDLSPDASGINFDSVEIINGQIVLKSSLAQQNKIDLPFPSFAFTRQSINSFPRTISNVVVTELDNGQTAISLVPSQSVTSLFSSFASRNPSIFPSNSEELVAESNTVYARVFDQLGLLHFVEVEIRRPNSSDGNSLKFGWTANISAPDVETNTAAVEGSGILEFDMKGRPIDGVTGEILVTPSVSEPFVVRLDFSEITSLPLVNRKGEFYNLINLTSQDGYPPGTLNSYSILPDGVIRGKYTSAFERDLGQLELARFFNPAGLAPRSSARWEPTRNSGTPFLVIANQNGPGPILEAPVSTRYPITSSRNAYRDLALEVVESRCELETSLAEDVLSQRSERVGYRPYSNLL